MHDARDYQVAIIDRVTPSLRGGQRPIMVMPTGSGKTFTAATLVQQLAEPTLWLAHRRELIGQAALALSKLGLDVGVIMAGQRPAPAAHVQVASIQTLALRQSWPRSGLVVLDEAHHCRASSYRAVLNQYAGHMLLGLTATPFRLDGKGLGDVFTDILVGARTQELIDAGYLIEPTVYAPATPDLSGVRLSHGDYQADDLAAAMGGTKLVGDIVDTWRKHGFGPDGKPRRTVVFAVNVAHSKQIVDAFNDARIPGVIAEHVDGGATNTLRDATLFRWRTGYTTIVANCNLFGEGFDLPLLHIAIDAQPTRSLCRHLQKIGRVMRTAADKGGAIVLDHAGNHLSLGFVTQHIEYSLDDTVGPRTDKAAPVGCKRCPQCYLMVPPPTRTCPGCGWEFKADVPIAVPGELVPVQASMFAPATLQSAATLSDRQAYFDRLEGQRAVLGFSDQWTLARYRERHGVDPIVRDGVLIDGAAAGYDVMVREFHRLEKVRAGKGLKPGWTGYRMVAMFGTRAWSLVKKMRGSAHAG